MKVVLSLQELNEKVNVAGHAINPARITLKELISIKNGWSDCPSELQRTKNRIMADSSEYNASLFAASSYRQVGSYLAIIAPYSGIISKRNIEVGSFVGNANEKPLFELEDNATLRLRVPVPEIYTGAVLSDNTGDLTTRSLPDKKFKTKLVRKSGSIDNATRSEVWEFVAPNPCRQLKAGSYADVKLHFLRLQQSLVVPVSTVVTTLEKKICDKSIQQYYSMDRCKTRF